jgi:N utilization substance protein A
VINAMSPAEVVAIVVDEESHSMDIAVREDQLSQAIGRNGQNVRLASQLTGWTLNVMTESEAVAKQEAEAKALQQLFMTELEIDQETVEVLVREGFSTIEEVAYIPLNEMLEVKEFDESLVKKLRERAKDVLLTRAIVKEEEHLCEPTPKEDLQMLTGMTEELAHKLAKRGITSRDELAEQSVDDLLKIEGITKALAAKIIMTAREPWFAKE